MRHLSLQRLHCLRILFGFMLGLATMPLLAHEVRPAYLQITEVIKADGPIYNILWKQPAVQNGRLAIEPVFPSACVLEDAAPPEITNAAFLQRWTTDCDIKNGSIEIRGLSVTLTDVMVRFDEANGDSSNFLLRPENPTLELSSGSASALSYLVIGVEHLIFGIDHLLFVVGLVLFIGNPWMLLKTVTAFTVAHSFSLALSVLGLVQLQQGPIEAVIALSIVFLARELLEPEEKRSALTLSKPWIMAFLFGLLHGLGFAGALRAVGLPDDTLWLALLLFNVGIELGQLLIIALLLTAMWAVSKVTQLATLTRIGAWGMGCVAAFWTIDRTLLLM